MTLVQVYKVARREYIARVRNKAFIFMTILVPAFLGIYIFVLPLLLSGTGTEQLDIAVVDAKTGLAEELSERLAAITEPRINIVETVEVENDSEEERRRFNDEILSEELDGYLLLVPDEDIIARGRYFSKETGNIVVLRRLESTVHATILEELLAGSGVDVDRVRKLQRSDLGAFKVSQEGEEEGGFELAFFSTLAFAMLLYMAVLINGQGMAMAIVEEKSSRLIEVILGAVTATEFMAGKIIGVLGSGLTQLAIWIGVTLMAMLFALPALSIGAASTGMDLTRVLNLNLLFYFAIFFALGYLLYSTLFAIVAATCNSTEELGHVLFPAMLPMIVALMATFYVVPNPSTTVTRVLSLIPLFTPLVMLARVNVLMPPLWEVWLGIFLLLAFGLLMAWVAAKVFRFALLLTGKRPSIPEIVKLIRAS